MGLLLECLLGFVFNGQNMKQVIEWKKISKTGYGNQIEWGPQYLFGEYNGEEFVEITKGQIAYYDGPRVYVEIGNITVRISLLDFTHYAEIGEVEK